MLQCAVVAFLARFDRERERDSLLNLLGHHSGPSGQREEMSAVMLKLRPRVKCGAGSFRAWGSHVLQHILNWNNFPNQCNQSDNSEQITMKNQRKVIYPSDNPAERLVYENRRYKDPNTGRVPSDMRRKELMFAKTIPISESLSKSNNFLDAIQGIRCWTQAIW